MWKVSADVGSIATAGAQTCYALLHSVWFESHTDKYSVKSNSGKYAWRVRSRPYFCGSNKFVIFINSILDRPYISKDREDTK